MTILRRPVHWPTLILFALLLLLRAARASAQATMLVDPLDPVYRDLDRLAAAGLVRETQVGQRPYSRRYIAHLIVRADSLLTARRMAAGADSTAVGTAASGDRTSTAVVALLARLREDYAWEIGQLAGTDSAAAAERWQWAPLRNVDADFTQASSASRAVPVNNGLGEIHASLNPLLDERHGRPLVRGSNLILETAHSLQSPHLAVAFEPELYAESRSDSSTRVLGSLQQLQLRALYRNLAIDLGREYLLWGQGRDVGLLGSNNAPGFDLIRFSNDEPFRLPWVFRHLGPTGASLFYADLGPKQNFPHAYLAAYKVSISPSSNLELGATVYSKAGGKGSPHASINYRIVDLFPFLQASFFANKFGTKGDYQFSDKYAGIDGRLHFPSLRGAALYGEILLNDFDIRRLKSVLWDDSGHILGLDLPRLTDDGSFGLNLEYHHTGLRYYEHEQYTSGQTLRDVLIGDPLGPDAQGGYLSFDWVASSRQRLSVDAALERRSNDQYTYIPEPDFGFRLTETRPKEWRYRLTASWRTIPAAGGVGLRLDAGYERTQNFDFVRSDDRNGLLARAGMEVRFR